jgi:uncharacterized phage protein (TIGR02218 family)
LFLVRRDGQAFGFTSLDKGSILDVRPWWDGTGAEAFALDHKQGLMVSDLVTTAGLEVENAEITTLDDGSFFQREDLLKGLWRGAEFWVFKYDYTAAVSVADVEVLMRGTVGESGLNLGTITIELRGITQALQQPIGQVTQPTCRNTLGDSRCKVNLASWTHSLTVTEVDPTKPRLRFKCASATQDADYFGNGPVLWTGGENSGVESLTASFEDGWFVLALSLLDDVEVGDTLTAIAGCRKRHTMKLNANGNGWTLIVSDCRTKFNNILNFNGEPHVPTTDQLTAEPNPNA